MVLLHCKFVSLSRFSRYLHHIDSFCIIGKNIKNHKNISCVCFIKLFHLQCLNVVDLILLGLWFFFYSSVHYLALCSSLVPFCTDLVHIFYSSFIYFLHMFDLHILFFLSSIFAIWWRHLSHHRRLLEVRGIQSSLLELDYVICHMVSRLTNLVMSWSQGWSGMQGMALSYINTI